MRSGLILTLILLIACKRDAAPAPTPGEAMLESREAFALTGPRTVRVCIDEAESYPFSFMAGKELKGIHVDIAREAITAAGFAPEFKFLPWRRCIEHEVKNGDSDTALSAAWNETRDAYLWYPADARELGPRCESPHALICNGPVLLVPTSSSFVFTGDVKQLPEPVRVTFGYVQAQTFKSFGKKVDEGPGDEFNVAKMLRDGTGSVLIWLLNLPRVEENPRFKGKIRVVEGFQDLSDGFLPFSKKGRLTRDEAQKVWQELKRLRRSPGYLDRILDRYPVMDGGE